MNNKQKTETKLKGIDSNGNLIKEEIPVFEMPTELKKVPFKPEGRMLAIDFIPVKEIKNTTGESSLIKLDKNTDDLSEVNIEKTDSGLFIASTVQEDKSFKGLVLAVGDQVVGYEVGDIVVYKPIPQAAMMVEIGGNKILLMEQYNLLGKYIL